MSGRIGKAVSSCAEGCLFDFRQRLDSDLYCASDVQVVLPCRRFVQTASQLDLPSLTPFSVARCGRLQLGVPHWATSVALLQVVDH